jgi:hypothetical protein
MRALIKRALVVVLCLMFLAPSALGRSRDWGKAHPKGDGTQPTYLASLPSFRLAMTHVWGGIWIPTFWFQPKRVQSTSAPEPVQARVHATKRGVRR